MATLDITNLATPAKWFPQATNTLTNLLTIGAALSVGDILRFGKLPDGARVVDVNVDSNIGATAATLRLGTNQSASLFLTETSLSVNFVRASKTGFQDKISVTDNATDQFVYVQGVVSGAGGAAGTIRVTVTYIIETIQ